MTATADRLVLERVIPGVGKLEFEQSTDRSGRERREYWLLAEGNQRRTRQPSVTTILRDVWAKPELVPWAARLGPDMERTRQARAESGRRVHSFVERTLTNGELLSFTDFEPEDRGYLRGAAKFIYETEPQVVASERLVCHPEQGYAGRFDLLAFLKDEPSALTLLDFKTNPEGNVYAEAHVQGVAYAQADTRCGGAPIDRILVVGVNEEGGYRLVQTPVVEAATAWAHALKFFMARRVLLKKLGESA